MIRYFGKIYLFKRFNQLKDTDQVLILSCFFSIFLMGFRIFYTGEPLFIFLVWNLFLALIPYFISRKVIKKVNNNNKFFFWASTIAWLLFLPNSFYILTDLFHLDMNETVPLWFDLALLLSFAWSGLLAGTLSIRHMERYFEVNYGPKSDLFFLYPVMFLNALGIYIGRYLRFNSWDVLTDPFQLVREIVYLFIHPLRNRFDWSMILCYSVLMTIIYLSIKKLGKAQ
jgi:uncharacterized membrane protein